MELNDRSVTEETFSHLEDVDRGVFEEEVDSKKEL